MVEETNVSRSRSKYKPHVICIRTNVKVKNVIPVSSSKVYQTIFCTEYNLSFHKANKDTFSFCTTYNEKECTGFVPDMENLTIMNI